MVLFTPTNKLSTSPVKEGRPTVMTDEVLLKLEEVFALGGTDIEACLYADISKATLYKYQNENPDFIDRKAALKEKPILKARKTIVDALDQPQYALEYLKRKKKDEFSERSEHTGADGNPFSIQVVSYANNAPVQIQSEAVPAQLPEGDGQRMLESGESVE